MARKKFKDTVLGKLLIKTVGSKVPIIGPLIEDALSPSDLIDKIGRSNDLAPDQKAALRMQILEIEKQEIERDKIAQQEVSKRWLSDNEAGALTRYVRPVLLIFLTLLMGFFTVIDSSPRYAFEVKEHWIDLWTSLAMVVYGGYFLGKSIEKSVRK